MNPPSAKICDRTHKTASKIRVNSVGLYPTTSNIAKICKGYKLDYGVGVRIKSF